MVIHRDRNKFGLVRNLWYVVDVKGNVLKNCVILQYYIDPKLGMEEIHFIPEIHGNSKGDATPFYRKKASLLNDIRSATIAGGEKINVKQVLTNVKGQLDFGDVPRSKKQIYDLAKSNGGDLGEVESILGCNAELEQDEVIWFHQDLPSDLWVCGNSTIIGDMQHAGSGLPLSIDPTFNHGKFEVTPFTYRHHCIEAKSKNKPGVWKPAVMLGPTIIQQNILECVPPNILEMPIKEQELRHCNRLRRGDNQCMRSMFQRCKPFALYSAF